MTGTMTSTKARINSREIDALCETLRQRGPVFRRMIGNNILISLKTESSPVAIPIYWVNVLDHVHRVTGHLQIGPMVANLADLIAPRHVAQIPVMAEKIMTPRLLRPGRKLDARQTAMRAKFIKQVGPTL